jgi:hypothetical protein
MPLGDAEAACGGGDRAVDPQRRPSAVVRDDLSVGPEQAARGAERLGQGFLSGEASRERVRGQDALAVGEQAAGKPRGASERLLKAGDLDHVDAYPDDHDDAAVMISRRS